MHVYVYGFYMLINEAEIEKAYVYAINDKCYYKMRQLILLQIATAFLLQCATAFLLQIATAF